MNLCRGMSNEIQVATIALPFRSSLTTFDTDSRIAELSEKVCCAPKELLRIFLIFLVAARACYKCLSKQFLICDDIVKTDIFMENAWRKQGHRYPQERLNYNSYCIFFQFTSRMLLTLLQIKGAVSRNSAKLGDYKMAVKLRETSAQNFKGGLKYHNRNTRCHGWAKLKNIETDWN